MRRILAPLFLPSGFEVQRDERGVIIIPRQWSPAVIPTLSATITRGITTSRSAKIAPEHLLYHFIVCRYSGFYQIYRRAVPFTMIHVLDEDEQRRLYKIHFGNELHCWKRTFFYCVLKLDYLFQHTIVYYWYCLLCKAFFAQPCREDQKSQRAQIISQHYLSKLYYLT